MNKGYLDGMDVDEIIEHQGGNDNSLVCLLRGFINEQHLNDPLREYLLAQAKDENGFTE